MKKIILAFPALLFCLHTYVLAAVTGTVTFEKRFNSEETQSGESEDTFVALYGATISIFDSGSSTASQTTTTGSDGSFSFPTTPSGTYSIIVYSSNDKIEVGSDVVTSSSPPSTTGIYSKSLTDLTGDGPHSLTISISEDSGAFNIFNEFEKGMRFIDDLGYNIDDIYRIKWPASGSYFEPDNFTFGVLSSESDPDEWDDNVLLHEFGHGVAESISIDHSLGGFHSLDSQEDMRLAWSEGLATYIATAVDGSPYYRDSIGETNGVTNFAVNFDVTQPESDMVETTNESAISYVLYQAQQTSGVEAVFETITSFVDNQSKVTSEQATMDIFHDLWTGDDLSTHYQNREMTYELDSIGTNIVSDNAIDFSIATYTNLTFYPDGSSDYFTFEGNTNDVLTIETNNANNGALTGIKISRQNGSSLTEVASNYQKNGETSDQTSSLTYTLNQSGTYIVEVLRFNSTSQNYGIGADDGYSRTAGKYGGYDLSLFYTRSSSNTSGQNNSGSSGGGGGGGCLLK